MFFRDKTILKVRWGGEPEKKLCLAPMVRACIRGLRLPNMPNR